MPIAPAPAIHLLWAAPACREQVAAWLHGHWYAAAGDTLAAVRERLCERDALRPFPQTFVAQHGAEPVGTFTLESTRDPRSDLHLFCLSNVFVPEPRRGAGIGRHLCASAVDWTRQLRIPRLSLFTESHADFYARQGWRAVGVVPMVSRGRAVSAVLMQLDVRLGTAP